MIGPLTPLDLSLLAMAAVSGLLAMYRGLSRELLSITSWIVAGGAAVYVAVSQKSYAEEIAKGFAVPPPVIQVAIGAVLFVIVLVIVHLITSRISDTILDSRIGMIDRILGFVFGAVRGFVIVLILFLFYAHFFPGDKQHEWVRNALSRGMLETSGASLQSTLQGFIDRIDKRNTIDQQAG